MGRPLNGQLALRDGWLYGAVIAIVNIILAYVASTASVVGWLIFLTYLVALIGYFWTGMVAARQTGRVATGTLAGMWAGIAGGIGYAIWAILNAYVLHPVAAHSVTANGQTVSASQMQSITGVTIVFLIIFAIAVNLGLGAGIGALGGLLGRSRADIPEDGYGQATAYPAQAPNPNPPVEQ